MLARYKIYRGKRPLEAVLPNGIRQDARKHTKHCLRPTGAIVSQYLGSLDDESWSRFALQYLNLLEERFTEDRAPFDELANLASENDVYVGCSCPTAKNPNVEHCHTVLALEFMKEHYAELNVEFPQA